MTKKTVVIIGAGPAGLTAALEILRKRKNMRVIILEAGNDFGGISKTVLHNGYRIDIGGHRFFSKSDWVMNWWKEILPIQHIDKKENDAADVMLVRNRLSRIFFNGNFFPYPMKASLDTALKLGPWRVCSIMTSYLKARLLPIKPEKSLEDFIINRFGKQLYLTFFKDYTEKVWGVPCKTINPSWALNESRIFPLLKQYFTP